MKRDEAKKVVDQSIEQLSEALASGHSEELSEYLDVLGRFPKYSYRNLMLILSQNPNATRVMGFEAWKELGRFVKKGEKGIGIFAPCRYKKKAEDGDSESGDEVTVKGFRVVHVFDLSQTDGEELPTIGETVGDPGEQLERLEAAIKQHGIPIVTEEMPHGFNGASEGGLIRVSKALTTAERFRVLAHEWAHEKLHAGERKHEVSKTVKETEAEAIAFAVCNALGIDTKDRSRDYIHLWNGSQDVLKESLSLIQETAFSIIEAIEQSTPEEPTPEPPKPKANPACNHTLHIDEEGSTWKATQKEDGRHYACSECDRFYGIAPGETQEPPKQLEEEKPLRVGRADYEERREERIDRLHARAEKTRTESNARYEQAKTMASHIPFGQPILVGHHSEQRDRNYRAKIHNNFGKAFELQDKAKHYERRADAAESEHAISADDPEAIRKLKEKLEGLESSQKQMKAINAAWRKAKKPKPDDEEGWSKIAAALSDIPEELLTKIRRDMGQSWHIYDAPFAPYSLSNNNANIRRVKERITELTREGQITESSERDTGICVIRENTDINRVQLLFDGKPSEEIRKVLKQNGFRWARSEKAWQRQLNSQGRRAAEWAIGQILKIQEPEKETA